MNNSDLFHVARSICAWNILGWSDLTTEQSYHGYRHEQNITICFQFLESSINECCIFRNFRKRGQYLLPWFCAPFHFPSRISRIFETFQGNLCPICSSASLVQNFWSRWNRPYFPSSVSIYVIKNNLFYQMFSTETKSCLIRVSNGWYEVDLVPYVYCEAIAQ